MGICSPVDAERYDITRHHALRVAEVGAAQAAKHHLVVQYQYFGVTDIVEAVRLPRNHQRPVAGCCPLQLRVPVGSAGVHDDRPNPRRVRGERVWPLDVPVRGVAAPAGTRERDGEELVVITPRRRPVLGRITVPSRQRVAEHNSHRGSCPHRRGQRGSTNRPPLGRVRTVHHRKIISQKVRGRNEKSRRCSRR